jgi:hypothetical protein
MHEEEPSYNQLYIQAWTLLSATVTIILLAMYIFGTHLLHLTHWIWDLLRYLATPII